MEGGLEAGLCLVRAGWRRSWHTLRFSNLKVLQYSDKP